MDGTESSSILPSSPIKEATNRCLESFKSILDAERGALLSKVEDNLTRFRIWAGNIGAYHDLSSRASADLRLRAAHEVKSRVLELLDEILETNGELFAILDADKESDDLAEGDFDPVDDLCLSASDSITSLLKVSTLLRKATSRDRYAQALASTHDALPPEYSVFDQRHVANKFPKVQKQQWLHDRLAYAITTRRRFLRYAQRHHQRIAHDPTVAMAAATFFSPSQHASSFTQKSSSAPRTLNVTVVSTAASSLHPQKLAEMNLYQMDVDDDDDNVSHATSFISEAGLNDEYRLGVIELSKIATLREPFECPYCHGMVQFRNQRSWRKHVFHDLRAYVCTFEKCEVGLFEDRNTWFAHEMECHRRLLVCLTCSNKVFHDAGSFQAHLKKAHSSQYPTSMRSLVDASSRPVTEIPVASCPMCDEWGSKLGVNPADQGITTVSLSMFKQHVGSHQEQLALFSITPSFETEVDSEDASRHSGGSKHDRQTILSDWRNRVDSDSDESDLDMSTAEQYAAAHGDSHEDIYESSVQKLMTRAMDTIPETDHYSQLRNDLQDLVTTYRDGKLLSSSSIFKLATALVADYPELKESFNNFLHPRKSEHARERPLSTIHELPVEGQDELRRSIAFNPSRTDEHTPRADLFNDEVSSLLFAATTGNETMVKDLLDIGVDIDAPWRQPLDVLRPLCGFCNKDLEVGSTSGISWRCKECYYFHTCRECESEGHRCGMNPNHELKQDLNAPNGATALFLATQHRQWGVVRLLLEHGADLHRRFSETLLPNAISCDQYDIAEFMMENGADVNTIDPVTQLRPLGLAVSRGQTRLVELLLDHHGARIDATNAKDLTTALALAIDTANVSLIKLLLERGASAEDSDIRQRFETARKQAAGWDDIAEFFAKVSTGQQMKRFKDILDSVLSHSKVLLSKLSAVSSADKLCYNLSIEIYCVCGPLSKIKSHLAGNYTFAAILDLQPTLSSILTTIELLHDPFAPHQGLLGSMANLQQGARDKQLLEALEQLRRSRTVVEYTMEHLGLTWDNKAPSAQLAASLDGAELQENDSGIHTSVKFHQNNGIEFGTDDHLTGNAHRKCKPHSDSAGLGDGALTSNELIQEETRQAEYPKTVGTSSASREPNPDKQSHLTSVGLATAKMQLEQRAALWPEEERDTKQVLSRALKRSQDAIVHDADEQFENAMQAYTDACVLLQSIIVRIPDLEKKQKLDDIYSIYGKRAEELSRIVGKQQEVYDDDIATYRCICGENNSLTTLTFIGCDQCGMFQHCVCMGVPVGDGAIPDKYLCEQCAPDDHSETLRALERGLRIWESRIDLHEAGRTTDFDHPTLPESKHTVAQIESLAQGLKQLQQDHAAGGVSLQPGNREDTKHHGVARSSVQYAAKADLDDVSDTHSEHSLDLDRHVAELEALRSYWETTRNSRLSNDETAEVERETHSVTNDPTPLSEEQKSNCVNAIDAILSANIDTATIKQIWKDLRKLVTFDITPHIVQITDLILTRFALIQERNDANVSLERREQVHQAEEPNMHLMYVCLDCNFSHRRKDKVLKHRRETLHIYRTVDLDRGKLGSSTATTEINDLKPEVEQWKSLALDKFEGGEEHDQRNTVNLNQRYQHTGSINADAIAEVHDSTPDDAEKAIEFGLAASPSAGPQQSTARESLYFRGDSERRTWSLQPGGTLLEYVDCEYPGCLRSFTEREHMISHMRHVHEIGISGSPSKQHQEIDPVEDLRSASVDSQSSTGPVTTKDSKGSQLVEFQHNEIVNQPQDELEKPKGILRKPTAKFPEHPVAFREGVKPLKDVYSSYSEPPGARWTKIDRRLVNPQALVEARERFEERQDCVIVLRVLTKAEIQKLADRTKEIRTSSEQSPDPADHESTLGSIAQPSEVRALPPMQLNAVDPDEDYRRRMEQVQRELGRGLDESNAGYDPDRKRRRRERKEGILERV